MRKFTGVSALLAGLALLFSAGAMPAYADPGDPPGANGTVKIHEYPEHKNGSESANDPKVCRFEVHGNNFDSAQTGRWWIQEHKWGNGDSTKAAAPVGVRTYTANGSGDWTDNNGGAGLTLADGHYKLFVEMTHRAGNSGNTVTTYKQKVFKIECGSNTGGTGTTGGSSSDVRTEYVCVAGMRLEQTYVNGSLAAVAATGESCSASAVAGFEAAPTGQVIVIVEGVQSSAPSDLATFAMALPNIASLPATSTAPDAALGLIGLAVTTIGAALLRRTAKRP